MMDKFVVVVSLNFAFQLCATQRHWGSGSSLNCDFQIQPFRDWCYRVNQWFGNWHGSAGIIGKGWKIDHGAKSSTTEKPTTSPTTPHVPRGCLDAQCSNCKVGYFKHADNCVTTCPSGLFASIGLRICSRNICSDIQGASIRLECQNKYFLVWTSSSVNKSIVLSDSIHTECYISNCKKCVSLRTCDVCSDGYFKLFTRYGRRTICVHRCILGYKATTDKRGNKVCKKLGKKETKGCVTTWCLRCRPGYYQLTKGTFRRKCVKVCPSGYKVNQARKKCIKGE